MRVLVTGADGFVGQHLVANLVRSGSEVLAACGSEPTTRWDSGPGRDRVRVIQVEITDRASLDAGLAAGCDAVVHLAAMSYSRDANDNPARAWQINAGGTAQLLAAVARRRASDGSDPLVLVASSAEVYGEGQPCPRQENEPLRPLNVYGATKLGAEIAAAQARAEWGLRLIVVRPFPATGPGYQKNRILSKWIAGLREGKTQIEGDPHVVRDFVDVRDAVEGYKSLLASGRSGETYNLSTGRPVTFGELFAMLKSELKKDAQLVPPSTPRRDAQYLVGDPGKIHRHTGWQATIPLQRTLADLIRAQTN